MSWLPTSTTLGRAPDNRPMHVVDQEILDELEFHVEMRALANADAGMPADQARQEALRQFGDFERIRKTCRRILLGERIMLQRIQAVLTVALLGAVVFLAVSLYQSQRANEAANAAMMERLDRIVSGSPPVVLETVPANGDTKVDPAIKELRVTYSREMLDGNWSWVQYSEETYPELIGSPHYLEDHKTCVVPVKLEPGKDYVIGLNSDRFQNFTDTSGRPAVPYMLRFSTRP